MRNPKSHERALYMKHVFEHDMLCHPLQVHADIPGYPGYDRRFNTIGLGVLLIENKIPRHTLGLWWAAGNFKKKSTHCSNPKSS